MMVHGEDDPLIPLSTAIHTRDELLMLKYSIQWYEYQMQHEVCMEEIRKISAWMRDVMKWLSFAQ